ncbi:serine-rich adhesin for platelets-like isoform X2 [Sipha flava]|uniref:Serine-rich adhesin for platelets-like isoform X2 n=1 Tax=Sipha flava TaxID=143950 RepID=A0A8B8F3J7_9HEMI|nr:serine-rich adhesin for platelets-like isoform X2 [Sipha flava]
MATEVGSDIALIQDEDVLRRMWIQTEDFGKKKEIRVRMYKLREKRLKDLYTNTSGVTAQTETTSKRSSARTHTESITDQGFMTMKTKEIRDSESPTEDYQRQSNTNKNYYVSSQSDDSVDNKGIVQMELISSRIRPNEEYIHDSMKQTSMSSSTTSKWESSQTIISVSEEIQKADVNLNSKFIVNEQSNDDRQLTYDTSFNQSNNSNVESKILESVSTKNTDCIDKSQYSNDHQKVIETYTSNSDTFEPVSESVLNKNNKYVDNTSASENVSIKNNKYVDNTYASENVSKKYNKYVDNVSENVSNKNSKCVDNASVSEFVSNNDNTFEDNIINTSENVLNINSKYIDNTYVSDNLLNKAENVEITTDNKIITEIQKLDSNLSIPHEKIDVSTKSNLTASNEEKISKKVEDQIKDSSKENIEGQYTTTYQHSYQQPKISVDLSPSHEAFARSLRSTPERSSPSPCKERSSPERKFKSASPERRFKSASPEKYRVSPEKSASPPKLLKSSTRRKLSSTNTKDLSKKRANTPTRYDSSDDSDCSGATHCTYDKYKGYDAKRSLFKEETKITSTTKYSQKSPSASPTLREKSPPKSPAQNEKSSSPVRRQNSPSSPAQREKSPSISSIKRQKSLSKSPVQRQKSPSKSPIPREKSPGYSSDGSVGKEVRKASLITKHSSHESSPERSAFKPVKQYGISQVQSSTQNDKIDLITGEDNIYTNNYSSKNKIVDVNNLIEVIKPEATISLNKNKKIELIHENVNNTLESKNKSIQEQFIIHEQDCELDEQIDNVEVISEQKYNTKINKTSREKSPIKIIQKGNNHEDFIENEKLNVVNETIKINDSIAVKPREKSPIKETKPILKDTKTYPNVKTPEKISHFPYNKTITPTKRTTIEVPLPVKKTIPSSLEKISSKKNLVHKDSKNNISNKTVKKDLSREKIDIKITRNESKTLIHKNSKDSITLKTVTNKPSQELLIDKKTTISFRNKVTNPETKPKNQEPLKMIEKKDSKTKLKPISPQSSQKKMDIMKSSTETKTTIDSKKNIGNINLKNNTSTIVSKPKILTSAQPNINETTPRKTKNYSKTISTITTDKPQVKKTTTSNLNETVKVEVTRNVELKSKDLEDELPPDNFESDTDLDDSTEKSKYIKNNTSDSVSSSSSSDDDNVDEKKIKELNNIRIEAEEEYGKKMTNKDALLNVTVQLPQSSRESSPEYSARFGGHQYCSVSDDASLPRYADVVSEPEDGNDYTLNSNRYDIVTDLDEDSNVTVADRVLKFLNQVNKQEDIKKSEIPQSPQAVRKTKQIFESIAKGQVKETDFIQEDTSKSEKSNTEIHVQEDLTNINKKPNLLTRKISGASDYKTRKEFFENGKSNSIQAKTTNLSPKKITRTSSIKERRASFEAKADKKTPLKDKTNVTRTRSPESKNSSPDRTTKSPSKVIKTEIFDVKVNEIYKSRNVTGSNTVKDRTTTFEGNEITQKSTKENKTTPRHQSPSSGRPSETCNKPSTFVNTVTSSQISSKTASPNRSKKSPEKTTVVLTTNKFNESINRKVLSKSPERKVVETPDKNKPKNFENVTLKTKEDTKENRHIQDTTVSSRQHSTVTSKTEFGITTKTSTTPKTTLTTSKLTSVPNVDDKAEIEDIFDLQILESMLEKAVGYDRRSRIRAQKRVVKRQQESKTVNETTAKTCASKNIQNTVPVKHQKQSNVTVEKTEYVKKTEVQKQRSVSPQKSYINQISNSRSPSPQKTLRLVEETRSPLPQKISRSIEKARSPSPQKTITPVEKVRSGSHQKPNTSVEKSRSPSPKKSVVKQQLESRLNKNEKSIRNSSTTTTSTTVTTTTKVKSEQFSTNTFQEQNVTDLITSSYGVGPTDDNGRPLFGLRALRKTNTNQSLTASIVTDNLVDTSVSDHKNKPLSGLKALKGENSVQESRTVHQKVSEQKGGVDQLITDHKGKPLFGLKALQSIGKNEEEPIYEDMPEPPVSPQLKELVLKHEKHAKESSKFDEQPRQKPKAKFRDSFILDTKDEGLYSTFEQNGYTDPNSISLHSIIKKSEDDNCNETILKTSKSQSTVFQSKSVMRSDGSGKVSVTQDFLKGEVSSVNDQEPSGKLTRGHYTYQSPDNSDLKKGIAKVTTVTTPIGKGTGPEITEITEELNESDNIDGNKVVKRSRTNDKFESIQKRFSQENFDRDSRRSSKESNGYERTEDSTQNTPRTSLVRGDSIKALQHKFQQATVSSSLKQNRSSKSDSTNSNRQVEEKSVTTKVNASKSSVTASSFLDNSSRVTGVQDVLTRMRNADLVVENGDTNEDIEARSLLNKFLGASVILHGMEHGGQSPTSNPSATTTSSASLVNQVEKQRAQKSPVIKKNLNEQELENIWDEKQLQILLESCQDYDQRRKIRARLRQIMEEHKEVVETNSSSVSSKTESSSYVKTEVHTRTTTSSNRLTKANSVSSSPFAKFQQLERQNSAPNSQSRPCYKFTDPALARSASSIKDRLLNWVKAQTKEYKNLQITNFSTSWSDGLAFCALIHHFYPEAFDFDKLKPENRRENFEIAFKVAEDEAGIAPLLDVEDMVVMRKPDWKCVFTYVQTFYRRFHNSPQAAKPSI